MKPYGVISDTHHHAWSAFASVNTYGMNTRLQILLDETKRCAAEVRKAGGNTIVHAGDLFHVRGSVAPSVLNPTLDTYRDLILSGFEVIIVAGNHDLEGKEANNIGSAITALGEVGCTIVNTKTSGLTASSNIVCIPWMPNISELKWAIEDACAAESDAKFCDLIIHAPIDGVIAGLPDHGLSPEWLADVGFRRVFAGHYHNHKDMGKGVYSIGALAHHTYGDVGSKAGFLIVTDEDVKWFKSRAPEFIDIDHTTPVADIPLLVDGNYVRMRLNSTKTSDVEEARQHLYDCGAAGVIVMAQKDTSAVARTASTVKAGASLEVSMNDYIKSKSFSRPAELAALCQNILTNARSAA